MAEINTTYPRRKDLYEAGLRNSYQKGIGTAKDGTGYMSIVLSGGYEDDEDFGDEIIYTGEGGRDPSTGRQNRDQTLTGGNLGLVRAFESGQPVYVTRGSGHSSPHSPQSGYKFAGEYLIVDHWIEVGKSGFNVVRFKLRKLDSLLTEPVEESSKDSSPAGRIEYTSTRIIRDTKVSRKIKELYKYACQVCGVVIQTPSGSRYAEGAHIKPLGTPHNGPDIASNILCLCPNHHLMFDKYVFSINPDTLDLTDEVGESLTVDESHGVSRDYLNYHWDNYKNHSGL